MGSTSGSKRRDVYTLAPARNLVRLGRFNEAMQELSAFTTSSTNVEASMLDAICKYRLGDQSALIQLRREHGRRLTAEHKAVIFRHEVLGHIAAKRFDEALDLLERNVNSNSEREAHLLLREALKVLRAGQSEQNQVFVMKRRSERLGIVTRSEIRSRYLIEASGHCAGAAVRTMPQDGGVSYTFILTRYMSLLIQISMKDAERCDRLVRTIHAELSMIDEAFKKSLPSLLGHKILHNHHTF